MSDRRQYFKYREDHHMKLARGLDESALPDGLSTIASSLPSALVSKQKEQVEMEESDTGSIYTETSFAPTETGDSSLRMPQRPQSAVDDLPFECFLCHHIVTAVDEKAWRKHVHDDLRPYVCLREVCIPEWRSLIDTQQQHLTFLRIA